LGIEEKYEEVRQLINLGRERGYLLYDEVNDVLPEEVHSPEDLDDMFLLFDSLGIEMVDSEEKYKAKVEEKTTEKEDPEEAKVDLSPGALEKTNDPVRMYLREMGTVPLLTREGEVEIARRIERGEKNVVKALSRSKHVINQMLDYAQRIRVKQISVESLITVDDEEEDSVDRKRRQVVAACPVGGTENMHILRPPREPHARTRRRLGASGNAGHQSLAAQRAGDEAVGAQELHALHPPVQAALGIEHDGFRTHAQHQAGAGMAQQRRPVGAADNGAGAAVREYQRIHRRRADEARGEESRGPRIEHVGCAVLLDVAVAQQNHLVRHGHRLGLVVRHVDHRAADALMQFLQLGAQHPLEVRVDDSQRLVEHDDVDVRAHQTAAE